MTLLNKLANLEFPDRDNSVLEACPLCPQSFRLDEFASHVYQCITKLDEDEKKAQEQIDERYALEVAFGDGDRHQPTRGGLGGGRHSIHRFGGGGGGGGGRAPRSTTPEQIEREERAALQKMADTKPTVCKYGSACYRLVESEQSTLRDCLLLRLLTFVLFLSSVLMHLIS